MNKEFKAKWLEALRSGKYKQGRNWLNLNSKFCCLGVACDIYGKGKWMPGLNGKSYVIQLYGNNVNLPFLIAEEIGLDDYNQTKLQKMNDTGNTFEEIADWIEINL